MMTLSERVDQLRNLSYCQLRIMYRYFHQEIFGHYPKQYPSHIDIVRWFENTVQFSQEEGKWLFKRRD
jgi:hypothetical protein